MVRVQSPCSHDHQPNKKDFLRELHSGSLRRREKTMMYEMSCAPRQGLLQDTNLLMTSFRISLFPKDAFQVTSSGLSTVALELWLTP
jgi:hypothetical protein